MNDELNFLQCWYATHCNGVWEHGDRIRISTIDNPGWRVDIELAGTEVAQKGFAPVEIGNDGEDWMRCWIDKSVFKIACAPRNLGRGLGVFRDWVV